MSNHGKIEHPRLENRRVLLDSQSFRVEWLHVKGLSRERTEPVHTPDCQWLFPVLGAFHWHLGASDSLLDANQLLFIAPGDVAQDSHPTRGDVGCLLLTPSEQLIEETCGWAPARLLRSRRFARRISPSSAYAQYVAASLANGCHDDSFNVDAAATDLLAHVAGTRLEHERASGRGNGVLIRRVREMLACHDGKLSLRELANRLGVSPPYLTHAFRQVEGVPLATYHRRLRLARALVELPHVDDITDLALRLGFSSHAHFSTAFKATYRETPSAYRRMVRSR